MEKIILVKPDLSYADEIQRYKKEFLEDEPIINGSAGLDRFSTVEDWLEELKKRTNKDTVPEGLVPSSTYLGIRKKDNYIVGMIDIRHSLNDFLLQVGGHIGCGVRKSGCIINSVDGIKKFYHHYFLIKKVETIKFSC